MRIGDQKRIDNEDVKSLRWKGVRQQGKMQSRCRTDENGSCQEPEARTRRVVMEVEKRKETIVLTISKNNHY